MELKIEQIVSWYGESMLRIKMLEQQIDLLVQQLNEKQEALQSLQKKHSRKKE